jgi:exodeoxyribonuclease VII large subunit
VLFPVRVQGRGAEMEIAQAIAKLGEPEKYGYPSCDVLIVGRGGGSIEDLWNFNEEVVARAIAACPIPIISAVGHEIDFTIADFVADLRAPTPSAAAELAVADGAEVTSRLSLFRRRMQRSLRERVLRAELALEAAKRGVLPRDGEKLLREAVQRLDTARGGLLRASRISIESLAARVLDAGGRHKSCHPQRVFERRAETVKNLRQRFDRTGREVLVHRADQVARLGGLLRTLGPDSAFQRGFSIAMTADGNIVTSADSLRPGDILRTKFADGEIVSSVEPSASR